MSDYRKLNGDCGRPVSASVGPAETVGLPELLLLWALSGIFPPHPRQVESAVWGRKSAEPAIDEREKLYDLWSRMPAIENFGALFLAFSFRLLYFPE